MRIYELIVEPGREGHIARHHVTVDEVEEVAFGNPFVTRTRRGRYRLIGQTDAGRHLTIPPALLRTGIVAPRGGGVYGLVTARDADDPERRRYREHRRR